MMDELTTGRLFDVAGRVVLVTGGARGIGLMIASGFCQNGAHVYLCSRDAAACNAVSAQLSAAGPGKCDALPGDLSTLEGCEKAAAALSALEPALHCLVNNSGVAWGQDMQSYSVKGGWERVMALNVIAPFCLTRALLPLLDKGSTAQRPACVINIGSVAGIKPQAFPTWGYDSSKAAIHHLSLKLAGDLADRRKEGGHSITVNVIAPGFVPSKMSAQLTTYEAGEGGLASKIPLRRVGAPGDMAGAALFFASPAASWVTGIVLPVDGGFLAKL